MNIPPTHPWFFQKPPDPCGIQGHQRIAWIHLLPPMGETKSWTVPVVMIVIKSKHQNLNETNIHFHNSIQHKSNKTKYHQISTFAWLFLPKCLMSSLPWLFFYHAQAHSAAGNRRVALAVPSADSRRQTSPAGRSCLTFQTWGKRSGNKPC